MILRLPPAAFNDNHPPALWICPLCENGSFLLEADVNDCIIVKCAQCFADCTKAVAAQLPPLIEVGNLCQP